MSPAQLPPGLPPGFAPQVSPWPGLTQPFQNEPPSQLPFNVVQIALPVQAASLTTVTTFMPIPTGSLGPSTLVALITTNGGTTNPTVSGLTLGGSADNWKVATSDNGTVAFGGAIWYDPGCAANQTTVVVNCTGGAGTNPEIYVTVYEVAATLVFDQGTQSNLSSGATAWTSNSITTTQAPEIVFAWAAGTAAVPVCTGQGGWATVSTPAGAFDQMAGYQQFTATTTAAFTGTVPSGGYSAVIASFNAASGQAAPAYPLGHPGANVAIRGLPARGRVTREAGTYGQLGPPAYPLKQQVANVSVRGLPPRGRQVHTAGTYGQLGPPVHHWAAPVKGQPAVPLLTGRSASRHGIYGQLGPPARQWRAPVAGMGRGLPPRGQARGLAGAYGQLGPPLTPQRAPLTIRRVLPPRGRGIGRTGFYGQLGPVVRPATGPVQAHRLPIRGSTAWRVGTFGAPVIASGPPVYPLGHPVKAQRVIPLLTGRTALRTGTFGGTGPKPRQLPSPVTSPHYPPPRGRVIRVLGTYQGTGATAIPLRQPVGVARQQPPLPVKGRAASRYGTYAGIGPAVIPLRRPVRAPQLPRKGGSAFYRQGTYTAPAAIVPATGPATVTETQTGLAGPATGAETGPVYVTGPASIPGAYGSVYGSTYGAGSAPAPPQTTGPPRGTAVSERQTGTSAVQ